MERAPPAAGCGNVIETHSPCSVTALDGSVAKNIATTVWAGCWSSAVSAGLAQIWPSILPGAARPQWNDG